jgi:hypothetical protein
MAVIKGNAGSFRVGANTVAEAQNWTLDVSQEYVDTTAFGDTFREQTPTFATWTGTASAKYYIGDTNGQLALQTAWLAGSSAVIRFYVDSTHYYSGTAYVSTTIGAAVDGIVEISWNLQGASALSYA